MMLPSPASEGCCDRGTHARQLAPCARPVIRTPKTLVILGLSAAPDVKAWKETCFRLAMHFYDPHPSPSVPQALLSVQHLPIR